MMRDGDVRRIAAIEFRLCEQEWAYATRYQDEIKAHWVRRLAANPQIFNGVVHVVGRYGIEDDRLSAAWFRTDFASYLHWREHGFQDAAILDGFASTYLIGGDGGCLMGRSAPGTLNGGLYVPPGGLLDERDFDDSGRVDVVGYALRELSEETGLGRDDVVLDAGFWVARADQHLAIGITGRSRRDDAATVATIARHNARDAAPEFERMAWIDPFAVGSEAVMPRVTRLLSQAIVSRAGMIAGD